MITGNSHLNSGRLTSSSANTPNTSSAPGLDSLIASIRQGALPTGDNGAPAALKQVLDRSRLSNEDYRQILTASRQGFIALGTASRDLVVHCPGGEVRVNRFLLSCLSPYLRAILGIRMIKDKENDRLELPGIPYSTFVQLCDYLHGADLAVPSNLSEAQAIINLAECAYKLQMPTVLEACDRALMEWFGVPLEGINPTHNMLLLSSTADKCTELQQNIKTTQQLFSLPLPLTYATLQQISALTDALPISLHFCPENTPLALIDSRPQYKDIGPRQQQELLTIASEALQTSGASSSSMISSARGDRLREIAPKDLFQMFLVLMQPEQQEKYSALLPDVAQLLVEHFFGERLSREDALWVWRIGKQHPDIREIFNQNSLQFVAETLQGSKEEMSLPSFGCAVYSDMLAQAVKWRQHISAGEVKPIDQLDSDDVEVLRQWIEGESLPLEILNSTKKTEHALEALKYLLCEGYESYFIDHFTHPEQLAWLIEFAIKENMTGLLSECLCRLNKVYAGIVRVDELKEKKLSLTVLDNAKIDTNLAKILGALSNRFSKATIDSWSTRPAPVVPLRKRYVNAIASHATNGNIAGVFTAAMSILAVTTILMYTSVVSQMQTHTVDSIKFMYTHLETYTGELFEAIAEGTLLDSPRMVERLAPITVTLGLLSAFFVLKNSERLRQMRYRILDGIDWAGSVIGSHIHRVLNPNSFSVSRRILNYIWPPVTMTPLLIDLSTADENIQTPLATSELTFSAANLPRDLRVLDISQLSSQLTNDLIRDIVLRCPDITNLTIKGPCPRIDGQGWANLARLHNLETLNVTLKYNKDARKAPLADLDLNQLITRWPQFKKVIVTIGKNYCYHPMTEDELGFLRNCPPVFETRIVTRGWGIKKAMIFRACPTITHFDSRRPVRASAVQGNGRELRSIKVDCENDQQMLEVVQSCPKLESMHASAHHLTNTGVGFIADHSAHLKHLSLIESHNLSNFALEQLARLPELETLHISEAGEITDEGVEALIRIRQENNLPPLKGISLTVCRGVTERMQKKLAVDQLSLMRSTLIPAHQRLTRSFKESKQETRDNLQALSTLLDLLARNGGFLLASDPENKVGSILEHAPRTIREVVDMLPILRGHFSEHFPIPMPDAITVSPDHLATLAQLITRFQSNQAQHDKVKAQAEKLLSNELSWIRGPAGSLQVALVFLRELLKTHSVEDLDSTLQMHLQQYSPIKMGVVNQTAELCLEEINTWLAPRLPTVVDEILLWDRHFDGMRDVELSAFQGEENLEAFLPVPAAVLKIMADQCTEHGYTSPTERTRFLLLVAIKTIAMLGQDAVGVFMTQLYGSAASQDSSSSRGASLPEFIATLPPREDPLDLPTNWLFGD